MKKLLRKVKQAAAKAAHCPTCAPAKIVRAAKAIKRGFRK